MLSPDGGYVISMKKFGVGKRCLQLLDQSSAVLVVLPVCWLSLVIVKVCVFVAVLELFAYFRRSAFSVVWC